MNNKEIELKLLLAKNEYDILNKLPSLSQTQQTNYYFYVEGLPLSTMVRIRQKGDRYELTVKQLVDFVGDIMTAYEHTAVISSALADAMIQCGIVNTQLTSLLGDNASVVKGDCVLRCVGQATTVRTLIDYDGFRLEVDDNNYLGQTDYELECECDDADKLNELKTKLKQLGVVGNPSAPKSKRFFDKLASTPMLL